MPFIAVKGKNAYFLLNSNNEKNSFNASRVLDDSGL